PSARPRASSSFTPAARKDALLGTPGAPASAGSSAARARSALKPLRAPKESELLSRARSNNPRSTDSHAACLRNLHLLARSSQAPPLRGGAPARAHNPYLQAQRSPPRSPLASGSSLRG